MPWLKAQFFGRSTQQDGAESIPDQRLLFNEPEVLAAIEAADAAHAVRTTKVESHQRQHTGGREAIPEHFGRIRIEHDLLAEQKICTKCATPQVAMLIDNLLRWSCECIAATDSSAPKFLPCTAR